MAWRSSGSSNDELVNNLKRFGVIHSDSVEKAFRAVDRRFFVPQSLLDVAHADQPLRYGRIHISAPHIYASVLQALDIVPSQTFLNVGSGTGYLTALVGTLLGPTGACYGVDIHKDAVDHCLESMERWNEAASSTRMPYTEFMHGNGLQIDALQGEAAVGFDRIYVGASMEKKHLRQVAGLLRTGGILVGPVEDKLVKIVRIKETKQPQRPPRVFRSQELSDDFSQEAISGVLFAPLVKRPCLPVVLTSRVWEPTVHDSYPQGFRNSVKEIMLCAVAPTHQPPRPPPLNFASLLPKPLWLEVLSYTRRDWFENPENNQEALRRRIALLEKSLEQAQQENKNTQEQLHDAERERDGYKVLATRLQTRVHKVMGGGVASLGRMLEDVEVQDEQEDESLASDDDVSLQEDESIASDDNDDDDVSLESATSSTMDFSDEDELPPSIRRVSMDESR